VCRSSKLESNSEHQTTYTTLTQDELNTFDYVKGDTEGIVNYGLSIKGIVFTAIL
jgi:phosphoesterase RecJ-like protein